MDCSLLRTFLILERRCLKYIVVYTCVTSCAVYLYLVPDTTCLTFVRSLKRFIGHRGIWKLYISDNAGCFLGPNLKLFYNRLTLNGNIFFKLRHGGGPENVEFSHSLLTKRMKYINKLLLSIAGDGNTYLLTD